MQTRFHRYITRTLIGSTIVVAGIVAGSLGYYLDQPATAYGEASPGSADGDSAIVAVVDDDALVDLTPAQAEQFEENTTPIDSDEVRYDANVELTEDEVIDRQVEMAEKYEVGEPLSLEDLEFLRAYLLTEDGEAGVTTTGFSANDDGSAVHGAASVDADTVSLSTSSFNRTKTTNGTTVNASGSSTLRISQPGPLDNGWSTKWTAKRTAGASLTKIKNTVAVQAYGAVAKWPFVGQIYSVSRSSTSGANAQAWSMQRSESFAGAVVQLNIQCYSYFWNSRGSWQLP